MTILGRSEELVSRCVECDLAEPESLSSLGGSAPGVVDGILSGHTHLLIFPMHLLHIHLGVLLFLPGRPGHKVTPHITTANLCMHCHLPA